MDEIDHPYMCDEITSLFSELKVRYRRDDPHCIPLCWPQSKVSFSPSSTVSHMLLEDVVYFYVSHRILGGVAGKNFVSWYSRCRPRWLSEADQVVSERG